jgi:hypothetical protein
MEIVYIHLQGREIAKNAFPGLNVLETFVGLLHDLSDAQGPGRLDTRRIPPPGLLTINNLAQVIAQAQKVWLDLAKGCETMLGMTSHRVPRRGERVRVEGYLGKLVVVRVDRVNNVAVVELWDDPSVVVRDVPFEAIHLVRGTMSEAA